MLKDKSSAHASSEKTKDYGREHTVTETSYVLEFSKTKTFISPQGGNRSRKGTREHVGTAFPMPTHNTTATTGHLHAYAQRDLIDRETVVSVFFAQYGCMQANQRRLTEMSSKRNSGKGVSTRTGTPITAQTPPSRTKSTRTSKRKSKSNKRASKSSKKFSSKNKRDSGKSVISTGRDSGRLSGKLVRFKVEPNQDPVTDDSLTLKDAFDLDGLDEMNRNITGSAKAGKMPPMSAQTSTELITPAGSFYNQHTKATAAQNGMTPQITPFVSFANQDGKKILDDEVAEFVLNTPQVALKEGRETYASDEEADNEEEMEEQIMQIVTGIETRQVWQYLHFYASLMNIIFSM